MIKEKWGTTINKVKDQIKHRELTQMKKTRKVTKKMI